MTPQATKGLSHLALLLTAAIWGSAFIVVKTSVDAFPPFILIGLRFAMGALVLLAACGRRIIKADRRTLRSGALIGVILFAAYAAQTYGITGTTPGKNAFLTTIYCVAVPFFYWPIDKKRPAPRALAAAVVMLAGIGLVSLTGDLTVGWGDGLTLLSGLLFAGQIVAIAKLGRDADPIALTAAQFAVCAALGFAFGLPIEGLPRSAPPDALWGLVYLGVASTAIANLMQNVAQKYVHPAAASILMGLESVFGVLFSMLFYGEVVSPRLAWGFFLIFAAVVLTEAGALPLPRRRERAVGELGE